MKNGSLGDGMRDLALGFKMFSNELGKFSDKAMDFFELGYCSYIELFVNPGSMEYLEGWEQFKHKTGIPFTLHAPHAVQNVNLANEQLFQYNKMIFDQINVFAEVLDAQYVVVHPGKLGDIKETVRQLNLISPKRMVIENKPYVSKKTMERTYRGATIEEIKFVKDSHNCDFCLDIAHNFCTANELGEDPYEYLAKFQELEPRCYHISGNLNDSKIDLHTHFNKCDWDLDRIFEIIDTTKNITVETRRPSDKEVMSFVEDVKILQG